MPRKTVDATVIIGGSNWLVNTKEVLGLSTEGEAVVTNEALLGQRDEEAEAHAAMQTVNLATIYDGTNVETLRSRVGDSAFAAIITDENFEVYPIDVPSMPRTNPINAPKTSSFSMGQSGRGRYSASPAVKANSASTTVPLNTVVGDVIVIIEAITGSPTSLDLGTTASHVDIPRNPGIHAVNVPVAGRTNAARLLAAGGTNPIVRGWILAGNQQPLANGAS